MTKLTRFSTADLSLHSSVPSSITFGGTEEWFLRITAKGQIEIGEGLHPDEAGRKAIEAMRLHLGVLLRQAEQSGRDAERQLWRDAGYEMRDGKVVSTNGA